MFFLVHTIMVHNVDPTIASATLNSAAINEGEAVWLDIEFFDAYDIDVYEQDAEEYTVTVDWGDGKIDVIPDSEIWYEGENRYALQGLQHVYLDDEGETPDPAHPQDATTIDSKVYHVTITVTDDDGGSDLETLSVTVNNVAPTVTITSIEVVDSVSPEDGGVDGQLDETEGFIVHGIVTDPGVLDTFPTVRRLEVDLNADGKIGIGELFGLLLHPETPGEWSFSQAIAGVPDDGASNLQWASNGTPQDSLDVTVLVADDDMLSEVSTATASIIAHNVSPYFQGLLPWLIVDYDSNGQPIHASVMGTFDDVGTSDRHRAVVVWGDGVVNDGGGDPVEVTPGLFKVTRDLPPPSASVAPIDIGPITVLIGDDDAASVTHQITVSCSDFQPSAEKGEFEVFKYGPADLWMGDMRMVWYPPDAWKNPSSCEPKSVELYQIAEQHSIWSEPFLPVSLYDYPWHIDDIGGGADIQAWNRGASLFEMSGPSGTRARLGDTPGYETAETVRKFGLVKLISVTQAFETCAVVTDPTSVRNGEVLGCVNWGHTFERRFDAAGNEYIEQTFRLRDLYSDTLIQDATNESDPELANRQIGPRQPGADPTAKFLELFPESH